MTAEVGNADRGNERMVIDELIHLLSVESILNKRVNKQPNLHL